MTSLILLNSDRSVSIPPDAIALRDAALEQAALIGTVNNAGQQETAVKAQQALFTLKKAVEEARKAAKEAPLNECRQIDATAATFTEEINAELARITAAIGDFQQAELMRARAAEALRLKELAEIERQRQAALAATPSLEQAEVVQEVFDRKVAAAQEKPTPAPVRADGQTVRPEIEFEVTDIHALYAAHPNMVRLSEDRNAIKSALKSGIKLKGVRSWEVVKSTVRATKEMKAIEV